MIVAGTDICEILKRRESLNVIVGGQFGTYSTGTSRLSHTPISLWRS